MTLIPKFDLAIATHFGDMKLLRLLARSLKKFVDRDCVGNIFIVINDPHTEERINEITSLKDEFGLHWSHVEIMDAPDLLGIDHDHYYKVNNGWLSQQAIKLEISSVSKSDYLLAVDSKNHFTKPVGFFDLFDRSGRFFCHKADNWQMRKYFYPTFEFFGLNPKNYIKLCPPTITPLGFKTSLVRDVCAHIREKTGKSVAENIMAETNLLTEFFLIYGYIFFKGIPIEQEFSFSLPVVSTIFPEEAKDHNLFEKFMSLAKEPSTKMFSVHRRAYPFLEESHKRSISQFWREIGLISDVKSGDYFLCNRNVIAF